MTEIHPKISPAFGYAPLIPPKPDDTNTTPFRVSLPKYFLVAFKSVKVVPCTIP